MKSSRFPIFSVLFSVLLTCFASVVQAGPGLDAVRDLNWNLVIHLAETSPGAMLEQNQGGFSPAHFAVGMNLDAAKTIAEKVPQAMLLKSDIGATPVHLACAHHAWDLVKYVAEKLPEAMEVQDEDGATPVVMAALDLQWDIVKIVAEKNPGALGIQAGATKRKTAPAILAALHEQWDLVELILDKNPGAVMLQEQSGFSPIVHAAFHKQWDFLRKVALTHPRALAIQDDSGVTTTYLAAANQEWDLVQKSVEVNPQILAVIERTKGYAPAHHLVSKAPLDVVKSIPKEARVYLDVKSTPHGITPCFLAGSLGHWDNVLFLAEEMPTILQAKNIFNKGVMDLVQKKDVPSEIVEKLELISKNSQF